MTTGTFDLIGCSECDWVWVVRRDGAASATCPHCGREYDKSSRKPLATADDLKAAAEKRGQLLKERWG